MNAADDHSLMLDVRDGDVVRLGVLFERYQRALFNFFLRLTANRSLSEDLVQEVFFRMLKYRHTYKDRSEFTTWMYQIARNVRIDHYRKHRMETVSGDELPEKRSGDLTAVERIEKRQEIALLRAALTHLPEEKREILLLSRFHNLRYDQIAAILGCDVGTVKVRVFRALKQLGQIFFELSGEKAS